MDVSQFVKLLSDLAEKSPEARAFVSVFMLELILLVAFVAYAAQRLLRRRQAQDEGADDDVTPKDNTISVLSQILAKTQDNASRLTDRVESLEAQNAGMAGKIETVIQVDKQFLEALNSLTIASQQLLKAAGAIRTRDEAAAQNQDIKAHVDSALVPIAALATGNQDKLTAIGANVEAVRTAVTDLPPRLDALIARVDNIPDVVLKLFRQEYTSVVAERNAEREQKEQALARIELLTKQNADMTSEAMAKDKLNETLTAQLQQAQAAIAALPKPDAVPEKSAEADNGPQPGGLP